MSYSFNNPCWTCLKRKNGCKDSEKIQKAINEEIHQSNDGSHQGSGEILMMCTKVDPEYK